MLMINRSGRIYDLPEEVADKYVATGSSASREAVGDMLAALNRPVSASPESVQMGCCNAYPNYCPNK